MILIIGCKGNDNNFVTLEDCVNTCGGSDPATDPTCSLVACDRAEIEINRAKGCRPIVKPGECCPSSWDCSVWTERLNRSQECFVISKDSPNGNYYQLGQSVPGMFPGCRSDCSCTEGPDGTASVKCERHECPSDRLDPEAYQDEDGKVCVNVRGSTDCYTLHSEVSFKCKLGPSVYVSEQIFYVRGNPCQVCTCKEGWNNTGTLEDNKEHCEPFHCPVSISHQSKLEQGCLPVYSEQRCGCPGPGDWICPGSKIQRNFLASPMEVYPKYLEPREEATNPAMIVDRPNSDVCLLPAAEGQHEGSLERWFFHSATRSCKKFQSGATLDELSNVFGTEEQCQLVCQQYLGSPRQELEPLGVIPSDNPICNGPVSVGLCAGRLLRYYYDKTSGTCRWFYYGGCGALPNTFLTLEECNGKCNTTSQGMSLPDETRAVCSLPKMTGPCKAARPSYYFDNDTQSCLPFIFGGCGGNGNRFKTLKECTDRCQVDNEVQFQGRDFCKLESDPGMCRAAFPRWYYDPVSGECRQFIWGGCGGNKNNFETKMECKVVCSFIPDQEEVPLARSAAKVCNLKSSSSHWCTLDCCTETVLTLPPKKGGHQLWPFGPGVPARAYHAEGSFLQLLACRVWCHHFHERQVCWLSCSRPFQLGWVLVGAIQGTYASGPIKTWRFFMTIADCARHICDNARRTWWRSRRWCLLATKNGWDL